MELFVEELLPRILPVPVILQFKYKVELLPICKPVLASMCKVLLIELPKLNVLILSPLSTKFEKLFVCE